ncbi:MoxR family ATPase [Candidatus Woesearchaeota archaeon]|nr:MoxR family ATPase [Candidatus Woesearchaeota archaeon]
MVKIENIHDIDKLKSIFEAIKKEIAKNIIGQEEVINHIIVAILCDSNALLESYPGLGKTSMIRTIASILDLKFSRIQSTPDLIPSDITGTYVIQEDRGKKTFKFEQGPIFANIVLADEINRATPKTQSALLEAMQEKQVTVGNTTYPLETPFFVLATQNPIDQEGTYPLPEAQVDRFLLKILITYPDSKDELEIVNRYAMREKKQDLSVLLNKTSLKNLQILTRELPIAEDLKLKVVDLVGKTRTTKELIEYGASPRASIGLILAAKAHALINGRKFVSEKDITAMAYPVLRHRIILNFKAEREGKTPDDVIDALLKKV